MIETLKKYALENNIPIILDDGIEFIENYIKTHNIKTILEIGTAIGYSSIRMALINSNIKITTIERNELLYKEAIKNINKFNFNKQINVIYDDAFNVQLKDKFDLIFIDSSKAQYIKIFEKFKGNLNDKGAIITDNLNFHGLVKDYDNIKSKDLRQLVGKIKNFISFLKNNKEFKTIFYDIGDGISISERC
ncbi:MAG: O-methyltransferase [Bacilli bacterium]